MTEESGHVPAIVRLELFKADGYGVGSLPPDTYLHIDRLLPDSRSSSPLEGWRALYRAQAEGLAEALLDSLPQGTAHALLLCLLEKYACVYRGPTTDAGPLVRVGKDGKLH